MWKEVAMNKQQKDFYQIYFDEVVEKIRYERAVTNTANLKSRVTRLKYYYVVDKDKFLDLWSAAKRFKKEEDMKILHMILSDLEQSWLRRIHPCTGCKEVTKTKT